MKVFNFALSLTISTFAATAALASADSKRLSCYNKGSLGPISMDLVLKGKAAHLSFRDEKCLMNAIPYNPRSPKYEGWVRVGSDRRNCPGLGQEMFGSDTDPKEPHRVYWLSISPEVQSGEAGFAQIGFENNDDPGAGAELKMFLRCYPARN